MESDFETDEMKKVFSSILLRLQEADEPSPFQVDLSVVEASKDPITKPLYSKSVKTTQNNSNSAKKINAKDFAKTTLARMQGITLKSSEKIKLKQEVKKEKELEEVKEKPEINKHSKKIGKRNLPVHERTEKQLTESKKRLDETKNKLLAEKEAKILPELTFKPTINKSHNVEKRSNEEFFQYTLEWKNRSIRRIEQKRAEIEEQITAELKFAPEIDANSATLVEQMNYNQPIEIRLLERQQIVKKKMDQRRKELDFPFAPVIDVRSRKIKNKKGSVFLRLFSLSTSPVNAHKSPKFGGKQHNSFSFSQDFGDSHKSTDIMDSLNKP